MMSRTGNTPARHEQRRTYGLRLSVVDGLVLVTACAVTVLLYAATEGYSLFVAYVVGHFFLFCNVFRIPRRPELIWSALFVGNCALQVIIGHPDMSVVFCTQFVVTFVLILKQIRQRDYHGIFARRLNARLDDYLNGH